MRRTVLYISMSLDGCLARPDGDVSWLAGQDPDDPDPGTYPAFLSTVDTVVMGWTTYHQVVTQLSPGSWPYRGLDCYVLTHQARSAQEGIRFVCQPVTALIHTLKQEQGKDIWICGGAYTAAQLIRKNAIDRYVVSVIPVILGEGIPLFSRGLPQQDLRLVSAAHDSNGLSAVKEAVASGAGGNTLALIGGFRGKPQIHGRSAGGGDQRVAGPNVTEVGCKLEWTAGEINILHEVVDHLSAEAFSLLLHLLHQVRSLNAFSSARPIVNFGRGHELAARFHAGNDDRFKVGACGIYRGGPASRAGTENDNVRVYGRSCHN